MHGAMTVQRVSRLSNRSLTRVNRQQSLHRPFVRHASSTPGAPGGGNPTRTALLALAAFAAAGGAYYYETYITGDKDDATFTMKIARQNHTFNLLSKADAEEKLCRNQTSVSPNRPGNPVIRWDRNWLGSNEPCEDRSAVDLIPRERSATSTPTGTEETVEGQKDLVLFSIIDGHGGWATSELLSKVLHPTLSLGLAGLQAGILQGQDGWKGIINKFNPMAWGQKAWTPENISSTLAASFVELDDNIVKTPVTLLPSLRTAADKTTARQTIAALAEVADNGACAISAVVDAEAGDLYVASAGDCRAVAGWEKDGVWRCDVLSEDQMGENPREVERIRKEHPGEEETAIMRGRVQGGLQPTRAFGDASYKWTKPEADQLGEIMHEEGKKFRRQRPVNYTPPYVTARPEVVHRRIHPETGEKLRFIVLATDGLWDRITSEESTLLLASYLQHRSHAKIHKSTLPQLFPLQPQSEEQRLYPAEPLPGSPERSDGTWCFVNDDNAATHLIRNSLGGGNAKGVRKLLSITGEVTRWKRDDITVTVVFFGDEDGKAK